MVAGAIVSGAYFGDKTSPLSETTNLAPAVAGADLIEHIRHMAWTSGPSIVIALILYGLIGLQVELGAERVAELSQALAASFALSPWLILAPVSVLVLIALRMPALPSVLLGVVLGGVLGILLQGVSIAEMLSVAQSGYTSETGVEEVDELLSRGGLESMFWTISLILCSMGFGGLMEATGMLRTIAHSALSMARTSGQLIAASIGTRFRDENPEGKRYWSGAIMFMPSRSSNSTASR